MMQRAFPSLHLPSLAMLLVSGLGLLKYLSTAAGLFFWGLFAFAIGASPNQEVLPVFALAWVTAFFCLLLLPSLGLALSRLLHLPVPFNLPFPLVRKGGWLMGLWLLIIGLGAWVNRWNGINWLLLPPLQVLASVLPLWWLASFGRRILPQALTPERQWGLISFWLVIGMPLAIVVEAAALAVVGVAALGWLTTQPELMSQLNTVMEKLSALDPQTFPSLQIVFETFRPLLAQPAVIIMLLLVTVVLIPMIEELLKPAVLWLFVPRGLTPAAGFAGGLLCGATFALVETLGSLATPAGDSWLMLVLGRFGTGTLHTTTAALVGWALASARGRDGIRRLALVYIIAVVLHGLWNVFGLLVGLVDFLPPTVGENSFLSLALRLGRIAPPALGFLTLILLALFIGSNRRVANATAALEDGQKIGV